ncbi:Glycosyltransferase involved in cell wall bisynthesis [Palleronia marisminoris]|uniref:D-inositol-3-phosphate glycosyltransferase n=1 Tax=Palleronia marisminoris TaxID=315423 RepID=A0A1Y5SAR8_9RHOB|nr:glycosyltransferase [Palleronia marisminoris]SFG70920.1 Glycosyltransferase involved in cell wall bisynthesis [Palleronia marisminoris]SLN36125.1 D-inositol-3-phosphate glycosyltransferase [Palleronia marisminoris]
MTAPVLITLDAVGGVWRYAIDLAAGLRQLGRPVCFAGFGPKPTEAQRVEAEALGPLDWGTQALDWMAQGPDEVAGAGRWLAEVAARRGAGVIQCNLPSLAAEIPEGVPVVAVSHSCLASWFEAVRGEPVPQDMRWIHDLTAAGLARADVVTAPSASHAAAIERLYGGLEVDVVHNASSGAVTRVERSRTIVAAGRWWDESKGGATLDQAARNCDWPVLMLGADRGPNGAQIDIRSADHRGQLDHDVAAKLIAGAGIFVSPSIYEPFGLAVLEAARAGVPLVLADIPTFRELWDGAAVFFPPRDADALAGVLNDLAAADARRDALGQAAEERAGRYSAAAQAQAMAVIHDRVRARNLTTEGTA